MADAAPLPQPCQGIRDSALSTVRPLPMCTTCSRWQTADEARRAGMAWLTPGAYIGHGLQLMCLTRVQAV